MRLHVRALLVALAFVACASGARAQDYSAVVVFGDSLSDSGNVAQLLPLVPPGNSFTTNPDPVWAEIVAQTFAAPGINSLAGGTNYAVGGACVNPDNPCNPLIPGIDAQIGQHLMSRPSGAADPNALYALWAGSNDRVAVLESALPGSGVPPVDPQTAIPATAQSYVSAIQRLQEAGARHIVVFNLPDAGATPFAQSVPDPRIPPMLTALTNAYNETLDMGLGSLNDGIVPINAYGLFEQVLQDPEAYGFTNVRGTACSPAGPDVSLLACSPAGAGSPVSYAPDTNNTYLFADGKHPSGAAHAMLASVVTAHRSAVAAERLSNRQLERPAGQWRSYVLVRSGRREVDALPRLGEAEADEQAVTVGFGQRASADVWWGAALGLGRHDDGVSVTAGSNTMAGRFTAEGFKPPRHWLSADVGVSASLGGQASAVLGYSGRSGDASRGDHLVSAGLRIAF